MATTGHCCEKEVKAFQFCRRPATVRIERAGCFCAQHAKQVLAYLRQQYGVERRSERIR